MSGHEKINFVSFGVRPALDDGGPELDISLIHLTRLSHVDLQILSDQGKEGGGKVNLDRRVDNQLMKLVYKLKNCVWERRKH